MPYVPPASTGSGAPTGATYLTQTADATLSAEQAMGSLATGLVKNTTTTGVQSIAVNTDLPVGDATHAGAMPTPPNDATKFLDGTAAFDTVKDSDLSLSDITTNNTSTTAHGLAPKATAPAAGNLNVYGIANSETAITNKTLLDTTVPSTQAYGDAAAAGTSVVAARVDHKHAMPATTKDKTAITGVLKGNGTDVSAATDGTDYFSSSRAIPAANDVFGIFNMSAAIQSQLTVAGTYYYITGSALTMPASSKTGGGMSTSTCMVWRFKQSKNNVGTAAYNIRILRGTNGSTADTADVTQSIGTATAAVDKADIVVVLKVTATGATGSYDWGIYTDHKAATGTGFGTTDATPYFNGSVSSVAMNTASLIFGIAFSNTTGTPTILTGGVVAQCYNMS